jgi:hypothetical protein
MPTCSRLSSKTEQKQQHDSDPTGTFASKAYVPAGQVTREGVARVRCAHIAYVRWWRTVT